jgi:purine-binding chemotaxis protein CheW
MATRKLLLFRSGGQVFALDADAVIEILPPARPTRIPGAPEVVQGLVNVRGTLVTVVDAARALGVATDADASSEAGGIVLVKARARPVGLAVDEVFDLVTAEGGALEEPAALPGVRTDLVRAVASSGGVTFVQLATDVLFEPLLP